MSTITIRGAITVQKNSKEEIINCTSKLLKEIIQKNEIKNNDIISIIFSSTKDLNQEYPAVAARDLGLNHCGMLCLQEMDVENSLRRCIRVLFFIDSLKSQVEAKHIYLREAIKLRPDLA